MFTRLKRKLTRDPEYSVSLRLVVLLAMLVPLWALGRVHSGLWLPVFISAIGISAGHWYSYHNLPQQRQLVRAIMFVAIHLAFGWLFIGLITGMTVPQAQFAVFAQAITSFDLRHRSSLFNTLIHSLAILYVAASLSRTVELGLYLLLFLGLVLAAFFVAEAETGLKKARLRPQAPARHPSRPLTLFGFGFGGVALVVIFIVFLLTPRFANRPIVPPFSLNFPLSGGVKSEIINPGVPVVQVNGWSDEVADYYYGFDTSLDLRYRGGLSDELVMYVRSPSRSYWRSHSYDFYDGIRWSQVDQTLTDIENRGVYFQLPAPLGSPQSQEEFGLPGADGRRRWDSPSPRRHVEEALRLDLDTPAQSWDQDQQIVQTFNIVREQPNLIFAAYRPLEIFISSQTISLDSGDGMRLPEVLQPGMIYSVVSYRPNFDPVTLRRLTAADYPPEIAQRYLQLPDNISDRVKSLALALTQPYTNTFDKVEVLNQHLRMTYPYNFFPPPHPPGAEVVDNFLFEDQEGVCEQFVTALVVMARSLGIPARLVSGYGAGDYNAITGYYEVRFSHAHSWAEVYFPEYGWVPFDPTPGWNPQPYPTPLQNWLFSGNNQLLSQLSGLNLPLGTAVSGGLAGLAFLAPFLAGLGILVGLVLLALLLSRHWRAILARWTVGRYSRVADQSQARQRILRLYRQGATLLVRRRYRQRRASETFDEYARAVGPLPALEQLSRLAEVAAYRPQSPGPAEVDGAAQALASLQAAVKPRKNS